MLDSAAARPYPAPVMRILGIDPGSRATGYGVIESNGYRHRYVACGTVRAAGQDRTQRLLEIFDGVTEAIVTYRPDIAAVEQVFVCVNVRTALKLGQAQGAALIAAAAQRVPTTEYTPRQVKQAVVGYGAAEKTQVQHMVKSLLKLSAPPSQDAADALAVAICHAHRMMAVLR